MNQDFRVSVVSWNGGIGADHPRYITTGCSCDGDVARVSAKQSSVLGLAMKGIFHLSLCPMGCKSHPIGNCAMICQCYLIATILIPSATLCFYAPGVSGPGEPLPIATPTQHHAHGKVSQNRGQHLPWGDALATSLECLTLFGH